MQGPQDFHHARLDGRDPPHWMLAYFLMLYHSCIIELHRTRLRGLVSKTTLKSAIICEQSSGSITRLTSIFLLRNPRFFYVHPSIVRYLYEGAAIWLTLFSLVSDLSKRAEFNQQYLILKRALQGLSHHTGASTFLNMLNETQAGLGAGPAAILGAPAPVVTLGTSGTRAQSASDLSFFHQQHQVQRQQMLLTSNPGIASSRSHQRTSMSGIALNMKPFPLEPSPSNAVGIAMGSRPQMTSSIVGDSDQLLNFSDPASFLSTVANTTTSLFAEQDEPLRLFDDGMYGL